GRVPSAVRARISEASRASWAPVPVLPALRSLSSTCFARVGCGRLGEAPDARLATRREFMTECPNPIPAHLHTARASYDIRPAAADKILRLEAAAPQRSAAHRAPGREGGADLTPVRSPAPSAGSRFRPRS